MRIIAGSRKGARIFAPKGMDTRPTGDRVREAVFNLIGPVDGADVLDLYAGSGAMGLEALSRGAERVTFVESDREAAEAIVRNLDKLRLDGAVVLREDAGRKLAAALSLFAAINVPLVYKSVDIWRTVHPKTTVVTTLDTRMRIAFWSSFLLITLVWTVLLIIRMRLERARADLAALRLDAEDELAEGRP